MREVSPTKRGAHWEQIRLEKFQRDPISKTKLADLSADLFGKWRDKRLREVSPGTVIREMQVMSAALNTARREWGLIDENPLSDVRRPLKAPPRDRLPPEGEIERMAYVAGAELSKLTARAFHAFLFSMEHAMRAGEVCHLTWDDTDLVRRVAHLKMTKNGRPRDVPLSSEAVRLIEALSKLDPVFGLQPRQLDALFRKVRDKAGVQGLTCHDSRHAAITMLARKLDVLDLARMVGHTNINQLMSYYNEDAASIAQRLG